MDTHILGTPQWFPMGFPMRFPWDFPMGFPMGISRRHGAAFRLHLGVLGVHAADLAGLEKIPETNGDFPQIIMENHGKTWGLSSSNGDYDHYDHSMGIIIINHWFYDHHHMIWSPWLEKSEKTHIIKSHENQHQPRCHDLWKKSKTSIPCRWRRPRPSVVSPADWPGSAGRISPALSDSWRGSHLRTEHR